MGIFCFKKLEISERVCHQFKKIREQKNITLEEAEQKTSIPKKYLQLIEECSFSNLPKSKVHRIAYVKKYAKFLGLNEDNLVKRFAKEDGLEDINYKHPHKEKNLKQSYVSIWLKNFLIAFFIISFIIYSIWQLQGILKPPKLIVYSPPEGFITTSLNVLTEGKTDKETQVTVNGQDIRVNDKGEFSTMVDLSSGINTINIVASKKHGKTTSITRNIIVKN